MFNSEKIRIFITFKKFFETLKTNFQKINKDYSLLKININY